jgi:hypothetical protein
MRIIAVLVAFHGAIFTSYWMAKDGDEIRNLLITANGLLAAIVAALLFSD